MSDCNLTVSFYDCILQHDNALATPDRFVIWSGNTGYCLNSIGRVLNNQWKQQRSIYPQFHKYLFSYCKLYGATVFSKSGMLLDHAKFSSQEQYIEFLLSVS